MYCYQFIILGPGRSCSTLYKNIAVAYLRGGRMGGGAGYLFKTILHSNINIYIYIVHFLKCYFEITQSMYT